MSDTAMSKIHVEVNKITGICKDPKWSLTFKDLASEDSDTPKIFEAKFAGFSGGILLLEPVYTSKKNEDVNIFHMLDQCLNESESNLDSALQDAGLILTKDKVQAFTFSCNGTPVFIGVDRVDTLAFYYAFRYRGCCQ